MPNISLTPTVPPTAAEREAGGRLVVHLVGLQPQRRTDPNEFIEDAVPLRDVPFALRPEAAPARVLLAPLGEALPFRQEGRYCRVTVPAVLTAQAVVFEGV